MQALGWRLAVPVNEAHNLVEQRSESTAPTCCISQICAAVQMAPSAVRGALARGKSETGRQAEPSTC